jgi:hypothetical protein
MPNCSYGLGSSWGAPLPPAVPGARLVFCLEKRFLLLFSWHTTVISASSTAWMVAVPRATAAISTSALAASYVTDEKSPSSSSAWMVGGS